jgi:hypothetical protein
VTNIGHKTLTCSSLLSDGDSDDSNDNSIGKNPTNTVGNSDQVYRTLNPLRGLSFDTTGDKPLHYEWSLGEPDIFV